MRHLDLMCKLHTSMLDSLSKNRTLMCHRVGISTIIQLCKCEMLSYPEFFTFQLLSLFCFLGKILFVIEMITPHGTALRWRAGSSAFNAAWAQLIKLWVSHIILCGKWCTLNDVLPMLQWCLLKRKWAVSSYSCHLALISTLCDFTCYTFPPLIISPSQHLPSHSFLFLFFCFLFFLFLLWLKL